jgi:phosphoribosyl-AMP cyclohydrolase
MPIMKEKGGYKWGQHGKLYKGKDARAKALKQGRAIFFSRKRQAEKKAES